MMDRKRIMMMGPVASGKTSLIQRLAGRQMQWIKTQAVEFDGTAIDTPGEYIENREYLNALTVTACDAEIIVFVQAAASDVMWYSPGQASMFSAGVIGVVTKIDVASGEQIAFARSLLRSAGARKIFEVSNTEGWGIAELSAYLDGWDCSEGGCHENGCDT